jgi:xanthine/CO dehydrogenase XdhC/CoxF family maturation factor
MARARKMLASDDDEWQRQHMTVILGPDMGQCCGGQMSLLLEKFTAKQAWRASRAGATRSSWSHVGSPA